MAPLVPVTSASHLLQQAQGVQWMVSLARVPSAPQVGSQHGRPYGWRRRCLSPRATSCLRRQAWLTCHDTCMNEVRVGFWTRTAHGTTHGNYPLPCPLWSLPRPLSSPSAEHAPVSLVAPSLCSGCPAFAYLLCVLPLPPCPCPLPSSLPALVA